MVDYTNTVSDSVLLTESALRINGVVRIGSDILNILDARSNFLNSSESCFEAMSFIEEAVGHGAWGIITLPNQNWSDIPVISVTWIQISSQSSIWTPVST